MGQAPKTSPQKKPSWALQATTRAALIFGSGTLTSRILGLIRDRFLFHLMPVDMKDAWIAAFRLPNFFRRLLGEGGLSVSFIPVYVGLMGKDQAERKRALTHGLFTLLMGLASLISLMGFFFMDAFLPWWLSGKGFAQVPGKMEMAIAMARVMIFLLVLVTLFSFFMALLNSHKRFGHSGYAPLFLNLAIIGGLLFFKGSPHLATASTWAVLVGGGLQAGFLFPSVFKMGLRPRFTSKPFNPEVKKVLMRFWPTLFGVGILQVLALVNQSFASELRGGISALYLGDRLLELPLSLIAVSLGTTLLPTLSKSWGQGRKEVFAQAVSKQLSLFYFLGVPAAFGLWFLGLDMGMVLFKGGEFTSGEVLVVGGLLKIYGFTLLTVGSLKILNQTLYATGDTLTPALFSGVGVGLHLFTAPLFMGFWGLDGLVLSTALVSVLSLVGSVSAIQWRLVSLDWLKVGKGFLTCWLAASPMGVYLHWITGLSWQGGELYRDFPLLLLIIAGGAILYFGVCAFLEVEEMDWVINRLKGKFFRKKD